jgi:predicted ester cyclase
MKQFETMATTGFPDAKFTVDNLVAEGDKVAFQVHCRMTHTGTFSGIAPTGKKIEMTNTHIVKIVGNKVMEWWGTMDNLSMMQQLGIVSLSGQK